MSVGVMKDYKLKLRNLRASHYNGSQKKCHLWQLVLNNWYTFSSPGPVSCQFRQETFRDTPVHLEVRIIWTKTVEGLKGPGTGRGKKKEKKTNTGR